MKLLTKLSVAAASAAVLATSMVPAEAMPLPAIDTHAKPAVSGMAPGVTDVQYRHWHGGGGPGWYGGYHGYRGYRGGYRYYDGYWYPLAAFGAGALIGGAIAAPTYVEPAPRYYAGAGINPEHYRWCEARYRSYDPGSNTFQPNHGPRQPCYSPYY